MGCLGLGILGAIALATVLLLVFLDVITVSFSKLGLSTQSAISLLLAILVGGLVNIPVSHRHIVYEEPEPQPFFRYLFYYSPPRVTHQVIAVNLGGAIIPTAFAVYLLFRAPLVPALVATVVVALVVRLVARPVRGVGIVMPAWVAPLMSIVLAFLLARHNPSPVAYISGSMGTLIGADLLNWPNFNKLGAQLISIGGAGVFDGIFLSGIVAALIA